MEGNDSKTEPPVGDADDRAPSPSDGSGADTVRDITTSRTQDVVHPAKGSTDDEGAEADSDPTEQLADFDWEALSERYHEAIKQCSAQEAKLMQEFEELMAFFKVWANSGHQHETDRTYSRLKTRMTHVQNSEEQFKSARRHYVTVVKAFESALQLLVQERTEQYLEQSVTVTVTGRSVQIRSVRVRKRTPTSEAGRHVQRCSIL